MATAVLDPTPTGLAHERVVSLRVWLDGRWAAVFSHPNDFAPVPTTPAGFVAYMADGVLASGFKPLAFAASLEIPASSWLDHAFDDAEAAVLTALGSGLLMLAHVVPLSKPVCSFR